MTFCKKDIRCNSHYEIFLGNCWLEMLLPVYCQNVGFYQILVECITCLLIAGMGQSSLWGYYKIDKYICWTVYLIKLKSLTEIIPVLCIKIIQTCCCTASIILVVFHTRWTKGQENRCRFWFDWFPSKFNFYNLWSISFQTGKRIYNFSYHHK